MWRPFRHSWLSLRQLSYRSGYSHETLWHGSLADVMHWSFNGITMKDSKTPALLALLLTCAFAGSSSGQQPERVFNWQPGNQEDVRLDPGNYHAGQTSHAIGDGGNMQVDIKSELPVTIFLAHSEEWNAALQHPDLLNNLQQLCTREHVVETGYSCFVPPVPMTLVIRDERYSASADHLVIAELGAVLDPSSRVERAVGAGITGVAAVMAGGESARRQFKAPNELDGQDSRWPVMG